MDIKYFIQKFLLNYAVLIIIGLLLIVVSLQMQPGFYATVVNQVATALLISGVSSGVYELSLRSEFIEMVDKNKKEIMRHEYENAQTILKEVYLIKEKSEVGLKRLRGEASKFSYEELIFNSKNLQIVLNDGASWYSGNEEFLIQRFKNPENKTTFIFLHPDSTFLDIHASKVGDEVSSIRNKIIRTIKQLKKINNNVSKLEIYGHKIFSPYSLYIGDKYAIITPYFFTKRPTLVLEFDLLTDSNCYYNQLKEDLEELKKNSLLCEEISNAPFVQ